MGLFHYAVQRRNALRFGRRRVGFSRRRVVFIGEDVLVGARPVGVVGLIRRVPLVRVLGLFMGARAGRPQWPLRQKGKAREARSRLLRADRIYLGFRRF